MSSSIPIPQRTGSSNSPSPMPSLDQTQLGTSLPVRRLQLPASITSSSGPHASKDDLATIANGWVPQPSIELVSRAARKWQSHHPLSLPPSPMAPSSANTHQRRADALPSGFPTTNATTPRRSISPPPLFSGTRFPPSSLGRHHHPQQTHHQTAFPPTSPPPPPLPSPAPPTASTSPSRPSRLRFDPWDFSEVVNASEEVRYAFETGSARATRPPRDGVSGTYFIRRNESHGDVLCVFKPVDEEVASIDLSPNFTPLAAPPQAPFTAASALSLGPAHGNSPSDTAIIADQFPFAHSPPAPQHLSLQRSASSSSADSGLDSRPGTAGLHSNNNTTGFNHGEGAYKEVAAYLLDHDRFAGVPQTVLARCHFDSELPEKNVPDGRSVKSIQSHGSVSEHDFDFEDDGHHLRHHDIDSDDDIVDDEDDFDDDHDHEFGSNGLNSNADMSKRTKMGAFQVFIPNVGDTDDFGPGVFDADQVHRIAMLDIRTLNHDRHGGNILVAKSKTPERRYDLIPIDHGFILPEVINAIPWPVWMDWPMAKKPLSDEAKSYIEYLDADKEARILSEELDGVLRPGSLQALKIATALLQKGVAAGLTLHDIGLLMYIRRDAPMQMSELQKIVAEAIKVGETRHSHIGSPNMNSNNKHYNNNNENAHDRATGSSRRRNGGGGNGTGPEDNHNLHRRHQSMSAINGHEAFVDDFIVKYAVKRITEVVARVAQEKARRQRTQGGCNKTSGNGLEDEYSPFTSSAVRINLPRARSIPDFGIGVKPVHALLSRGGSTSNGSPAQVALTPTPTPASSPTYSHAASNSELNAAGIGDKSSTNESATGGSSVTGSGNGGGGESGVGLTRPKVRQSPIDIPVNDKRRVGPEQPQPRTAALIGNGELERIGSSGNLPPVFKRGSSERKPSPIAPMELVNWNPGTP